MVPDGDSLANKLQAENNRLIGELDTERNQHLQQIAKNTAREITPAEKNAAILRKYLRSKVVVSEFGGHWGDTPEIVEVTEDNLAKLFTPHGYQSGVAMCNTVDCGQIEIIEIAQGDCPLRIKILKRYGDAVHLGEITRWEDRALPAAKKVVKGDNVCTAHFSKGGSAERPWINVYRSKADAKLYVLESSNGVTTTGDSVKISKDFYGLQVDYLASGFTTAGGSRNGGGLFIL